MELTPGEQRSAGTRRPPTAVPVRVARATATPPLLQLQRLAGNRAVGSLVQPHLQRQPPGTITAPESTTPQGASTAEGVEAGETRQVTAIPAGGTPVGKVGVVNRDTAPELRLQATPDTEVGPVLRSLPFNEHVQVIKEFPGDWYFVSTPEGDLGYVAKTYVWTTAPEANATLHRVESGPGGTAIGIAEKYYGAYSDDWGQDLRFYVNVLAWANHIAVPDETDGWKSVQFAAGNLIWIPGQPFARSLSGVVNSGSRSYNVAEALGVARLTERVAEIWGDFASAFTRSGRYLGAAVRRHGEEAVAAILVSLATLLIAAVAVLAVSSAIGAAIGGLTTAGVGAAPGAAAGFEVGMVLLNWLGLASLVVWIGQSLVRAGSAFGHFLASVWKARGDEKTIDLAAEQFADAIGLLLGLALEGVVMLAASKGLGHALGVFRGSRLGTSFGRTRSGEWLNERLRRVRAGEVPLKSPREALTSFYRGVELVDAKNSPIGEFDGVDIPKARFVENKTATGLGQVNPTTGRPGSTEAQWAAKQITTKTTRRITALASASGTRPTVSGSAEVPPLAQIQGIKRVHFVIDGQTPALRAAVQAELAALRQAFPAWEFTAEFGTPVTVVPVPSSQADGPSSTGE